MMTMILLLVLALLIPVSESHAQPTPVECPLPPYQLPLQTPDRAVVDDAGQLSVDGVPVELPDGLTVHQQLWSDDGDILLIAATSPEFDSRVFTYRDGTLTEILGADELLALRAEGFKEAVTIYDAVFVPGTHTVLFNTELLTDGNGIYVEIPSDLWSLDLDSGELTGILTDGEGGKIHVAPDSSTVVLLGYDFIRQLDLDGGNARTLFEGTVAIGISHGAAYPDLVWDNEADIPTFRVLLLPAFDPNIGNFDVPFEVHEFVLGAEVESRLIFDGPSEFLPLGRLSPDGNSVAQWVWLDASATQNPSFDVTVLRPDTEPLLLASVQISANGVTPFIRWDDPMHLTYGYIDTENTVTSWRADLCGEITELEPYQSSMADVLSR